MAKGYTLEELKKMGAKPATSTSSTGGLTLAQLQSRAPESSSTPSIIDSIWANIGNAAVNRGNQVVGAFNAIGQSRSPVEAIARTAQLPLRAVGSVAGFTNDVIGQAVSPVLQATGLDKPIAAGVNAIAQSPAGQAIGNTWNQIPQEVQTSLRDTGNIAALTPVGKVAELSFKAAQDAARTYNAARASTRATPLGSGAVTAAKDVVRDVTPTAERLVNHEVTRALDLTQGDVKNISLSTGNEVGSYMAQRNLIGNSLDETVGLLRKNFDENYTAVRNEIANVNKTYQQYNVPRYVDALKQLSSKIRETPGLENTIAEVDNLLNKKSLVLDDVQRVKELMDEHTSLYKATGDVKEGVAKQGLDRIRTDLKVFIENEVKNTTGADIATLNNNVATSRGILDAIEARSTRGLTRANITPSDAGFLTAGAVVGGPIGAGAAFLVKKIYDSPSFKFKFAKFIDSLNDSKKAKIKSQLEAGTVPDEIQDLYLPSSPSSKSSTNQMVPNKARITNDRNSIESKESGSTKTNTTRSVSEPPTKSTTLKQKIQGVIGDIKKNGQRGFVANPFAGGKFPDKVIRQLNASDKNLMEKYIDSVRLKGEKAPTLTRAQEADLDKLNELLNINPDQSAETIAKQYEQVLPRITSQQPRGEDGKFLRKS